MIVDESGIPEKDNRDNRRTDSIDRGGRRVVAEKQVLSAVANYTCHNGKDTQFAGVALKGIHWSKGPRASRIAC